MGDISRDVKNYDAYLAVAEQIQWLPEAVKSHKHTHSKVDWCRRTLADRRVWEPVETEGATSNHRTMNQLYDGVTSVLAGRFLDKSETPLRKPLIIGYDQAGGWDQTEVIDKVYSWGAKFIYYLGFISSPGLTITDMRSDITVISCLKCHSWANLHKLK